MIKGITFLEALQVTLIILKVVGIVKWPWLQILIPTWIFLGLFVIDFIIEIVKNR